MEHISISTHSIPAIHKAVRALEEGDCLIIEGEECLLKIECNGRSYNLWLPGKVSYKAVNAARIDVERVCMYFSRGDTRETAKALDWMIDTSGEFDGYSFKKAEFTSNFSKESSHFGGERWKEQRETRIRNEQEEKAIERRQQLAVAAKKAKSNSPNFICPHCKEAGFVFVKNSTKKMGVSGSKATAAILTSGLSLLAVGLSRKEDVTEAHCYNCNSDWHF